MQDHLKIKKKYSAIYGEEESLNESNKSKRSTKPNNSTEKKFRKKKFQQRKSKSYYSKTEINRNISEQKNNNNIFSEKNKKINTVKNTNYHIKKLKNEDKPKKLTRKKRARSYSSKSPKNEFNNKINGKATKKPKTEINKEKENDDNDDNIENENSNKIIIKDVSKHLNNSKSKGEIKIKDNQVKNSGKKQDNEKLGKKIISSDLLEKYVNQQPENKINKVQTNDIYVEKKEGEDDEKMPTYFITVLTNSKFDFKGKLGFNFSQKNQSEENSRNNSSHNIQKSLFFRIDNNQENQGVGNLSINHNNQDSKVDEKFNFDYNQDKSDK